MCEEESSAYSFLKFSKNPIALFLIFLLVNLNAFIVNVIGRFENTMNGSYLNNKGYFIQGILLVMIFIVYDLIAN